MIVCHVFGQEMSHVSSDDEEGAMMPDAVTPCSKPESLGALPKARAKKDMKAKSKAAPKGKPKTLAKARVKAKASPKVKAKVSPKHGAKAKAKPSPKSKAKASPKRRAKAKAKVKDWVEKKLHCVPQQHYFVFWIGWL